MPTKPGQLNFVLPFMLIVSLLSLLKLASTLMMSIEYREHFLTDGEWIMKHVDPRFGAGGLLIPIISKPDPPQYEDYENDIDHGTKRVGKDDVNYAIDEVIKTMTGPGSGPRSRPARPRRGKKSTIIYQNQNSGAEPAPAAEEDASAGAPSVELAAQPAANTGGGSAEKSNEGSGFAGKNNTGGFAGKPYCAEYKPGEPLPYFYNELAMDGTTGGIAIRGPALVANKLKLNSEMKAQSVPDELRPLIMAFAMIETDDLTLDQITEFMKSKTMENGRCFGIMNVNFGHRNYLKLDGEMSNAELDGLTDKYYAGKDKENAEKTIMRESVKVFNTSFTKIGIYCTILFHRGGSTLFNDNALGAHKEWHPQIFLDSVANTYNAIVKDMKLMTDDRRVWFNVKEV